MARAPNAMMVSDGRLPPSRDSVCLLLKLSIPEGAAAPSGRRLGRAIAVPEALFLRKVPERTERHAQQPCRLALDAAAPLQRFPHIALADLLEHRFQVDPVLTEIKNDR